MRENADLLILDEPSSGLDPQAEYDLFQTLNMRRKTTIYIVIPLFACLMIHSRINAIQFVRRQRFWLVPLSLIG